MESDNRSLFERLDLQDQKLDSILGILSSNTPLFLRLLYIF